MWCPNTGQTMKWVWVLLVILIIVSSCSTLCGCAVVPTLDTKNNTWSCCSVYSEPYPGVETSGNYKKTGNQWQVNGKVSWKYLNGF